MDGLDPSATLRHLVGLAGTDDDARDVVLQRVRDMALRYARARLGRFGAEDAAQDVAQEVCMAVLTALPAYEDRGLPFEAFVYTIAARKLADAQRSAMRSATPVAEVPEGVDPAHGPEAAAVLHDEAGLALSLMERLPAQQREIITLRVAVGFSTEETAAALGMTPGAVRVAQHRGLTRLRALLAAREDGVVA